jgi:hypothetical protein
MLRFMNHNKTVRCAKRTLEATLAALIVGSVLFGCAQRIAVTERSDLIAGSHAARIPVAEKRKVFTNFMPQLGPAGQCASRNGRLILYPDGSWEWEAETISSSDRSRWEQTFHFYDSDRPDRTWFGSRDGGSWDLHHPNVWTYWRYGRGAADLKLSEAFDKIGYVVWAAGC